MDNSEYISSDEISNIFKLLSHPMRVRIIDSLNSGPATYTSLLEKLDNPSTGTLNFHLNKLAILIEKKDDLYVLTSLGEKATELIETYKDDLSQRTEKDVTLRPRNTNPVRDFLDISAGYLPLVLIFIFLSLGVIVNVLMRYENTSIYIFLITIVFEVVAIRFIMEKIYRSDQPVSLLKYSILSFTLIWTFYQMIVHIAILSDVFYSLLHFVLYTSEEISIENPLFPGQGDLFGDLLDNQQVTTLESLELIYPLPYKWHIHFLLLGCSLIIGIVWTYYQYGDFPVMRNNLPRLTPKSERPSVTVTPDISIQHKFVTPVFFALGSSIGGFIVYLVVVFLPKTSFWILYLEAKLLVMVIFIAFQLVSLAFLARLSSIDFESFGHPRFLISVFPYFILVEQVIITIVYRVGYIKIINNVPGIEFVEDGILFTLPIYNYFDRDNVNDYPSIYLLLFIKTVIIFLILYGLYCRRTDARIHIPLGRYEIVLVVLYLVTVTLFHSRFMINRDGRLIYAIQDPNYFIFLALLLITGGILSWIRQKKPTLALVIFSLLLLLMFVPPIYTIIIIDMPRPVVLFYIAIEFFALPILLLYKRFKS